MIRFATRSPSEGDIDCRQQQRDNRLNWRDDRELRGAKVLAVIRPETFRLSNWGNWWILFWGSHSSKATRWCCRMSGRSVGRSGMGLWLGHGHRTEFCCTQQAIVKWRFNIVHVKGLRQNWGLWLQLGRRWVAAKQSTTQQSMGN